MTVYGIIASLLIFLGFVFFIIFAIAIYNILTKSFDPQKSYLVLGIVLSLFAFNLVFALLNLSQFIDKVDVEIKKQGEDGGGLIF